MKKLLLLLDWEESRLEALTNAAAAAGLEILCTKTEALTPEERAEIQVIFGNPPPALLKQCPALSWIQLGSAGADAYIRPGVLPEGVLLTNASGAYGHAIGEYMTGAVLALYKHFHLYRDLQSQGAWKDLGRVKSLLGSHVLVVGMGNIGGEFAKRMHALGAHVIGICRTPREKPEYVESLCCMDALDRLLPWADVVSLSLPSTPQTAGLFSQERLSRMKPSAVLINVGRGNAVDTEALCDALSSGALGGCALDVTDPEPLPPSHRLWKIPSAIITPHVSGGYHLEETYEAVLSICLANLSRYGRGEELENLVDTAAGY